MKCEICTGYQKQTGWIASDDGYLVLDHNFNQSVDNAAELLSNPLVVGQGLLWPDRMGHFHA